jgi:hypothetical protein
MAAGRFAAYLASMRTIGLRILSLALGLTCLALIARWWGRSEIAIGGHRLGTAASVSAIVITGVGSIWLAKQAGPWSREMAEGPPPTP